MASIRYPTSSHIKGLNHGDLVVLPTPTTAYDLALWRHAVEVVACLPRHRGRGCVHAPNREDLAPLPMIYHKVILAII